MEIRHLDYSQIVFAVFFQAYYTSTYPSALSYLGMAIIIGAGVWSVVSPMTGPEPSLSQFKGSPSEDRSVSDDGRYQSLPQENDV